MANSYNELMGIGVHSTDANAEGWWLMQDDAASTAVVDQLGVDNAVLNGGDNTSAKATTGPNNWLTSGLALNGSDDYIDGFGVETTLGTAPYTVMCRVNFSDLTNTQRFISFRDGTNGFHAWIQSSEIGATHYDGVFHGVSRSTTGLSTGTWYNFYAAVSVTPTVTCRINNAAISGTTTRGTGVGDFLNLGCGSDETLFSPTTYAELAVFTDLVTLSEAQQWEAGPEPNYTSGVSWSANGTYSVGTWALPAPFASGTNGTATYEVVAANAAGSVIDSATSSSGDLDISAENGNTVYLLVRATNSGGYDIGDKATRTSAYGSSNDGYYELASVTASDGAGGGPSHASTMLLAGVGI